MQEFLNIRFNYLCRTTYQNEAGQCLIVLRIICRSQRRDIFAGLYCSSKDWAPKNKKVSKASKDSGSLNQNLDLILRKASDAFDELKFGGNTFSIAELVDKIKGKENRPTTLIDFLEDGNEKMKKRVGTEILMVTYMKYKRGGKLYEGFSSGRIPCEKFQPPEGQLGVFGAVFSILGK